jgi:hypothetical protein
MKHIKLFNESALPMPRVVNKEETFELSYRERVNFKSTEIDTMCRILLVDKRPRFKEVTDKNWFSPDGTKLSRMAFDCYINRPPLSNDYPTFLLGKDGKVKEHILLRIFKFDDDWFIIEELSYEASNRWLIADQFDEVKNYLETL